MHGNRVESIFPLTEAQRGLLFHSTHAQNADPGLIQVRCTLSGRLDVERFADAWRAVIAHHPALRTAIVWEDVEAPLNVVLRSASFDLDQLDRLAHEDRDARLDTYLQRDRLRGLDLGHPPVVRVVLIRTGDEEWLLVWTCHHILLDGWSGTIVLRDVLQAYQALHDGIAPRLDPAPPFKAYADLVARQPHAAAESYWREELRGFADPTPLLVDAADPSDGARRRYETPGPGELLHCLSRKETAALAATARHSALTVGTVLQGAWALALSATCGRRDVVFGTTVSGRALDLPGIERTVGLCANSVPVRVRIDPEEPVRVLLTRLQEASARSRPFENVSPATLQRWTEIPPSRRLYDSLVVIETLPELQQDGVTSPGEGVLHIRDFRGGITSGFPLTLLTIPGEELGFTLIYDTRRFDADSIASLAGRYRAVLERLVDASGLPAGAILEGASTRADLRLAYHGDGNRMLDDPARNAAPVSGDAAQVRGDVELGAGEAAPGAGEAAPGARARRAEEAPADDLEQRLLTIWEDVLGTSPLGVLDDFFDVGGHSIAAAHLFERVERELGIKLPLATLFELSTIRALAGALRRRGWSPAWNALVRMGGRGTRPPLFCVHSWAGNVLFYRDFARHLAPDQPVYGLQAIGLDGSTLPPSSIPDIARAYLAEIRELYPKGPYALLGMCFGNAVALEMAAQLKADGLRVPALFILDSSIRNPNGSHRDPKQLARRLSQAAEEGQLLELVQGYVTRKSRGRMQRYRRAWQRARHRSVVHQVGPAADPFHAALRTAWMSYEPVPFDGTITFIRSTVRANNRRYDYEVQRWSEFARAVDVELVSGGHMTFMSEPHVREVAEAVQRRLDRV